MKKALVVSNQLTVLKDMYPADGNSHKLAVYVSTEKCHGRMSG